MNRGFLAAATAILWTLPARGQAAESRLWLTGDSTLHAFSSSATELGLAVEFAPNQAALSDLIIARQVTRFDVRVPVQGLKSGESKLDKNMYAALKAKECPEIAFHMDHYEVIAGTAAGKFGIKAAGRLTIAGKERTVELEGAGSAEGDKVRVRGERDLRMTDYGIKPPSFLGMLKTKDRVVVHYDLMLTKESLRRLP